MYCKVHLVLIGKSGKVKNERNRVCSKGFTLVELLIVLAIIAIMAAMSIPAIDSVRKGIDSRSDSVTAEIYQQAIATFSYTDYSAMLLYKNNGVTADSGKYINGSLQYSGVVQLTDAEINALNGAGRGKTPTTVQQVKAVIKVVTGEEAEKPKKTGYSFYYNTLLNMVECKVSNLKISGLLEIT